MISEVDFKAALADLNARVAKRDARIKELKARAVQDAEAAKAATEQLAAAHAAALALKARIAKLEARIVRRDARIAKKAAAAESAVQQLAVKDTELAAKDEQIAALIARFAQFEEAATATGDSHQTVKQEPQEAERPRKKRPRQGITHQHHYNIISYCNFQIRHASHKSSCKHCVPSDT
jgi:chromosome segregation ATPase